MSVMELLKKVKIKTLSFEKHPCRDLDLETKVHYLNGLALLTHIDGNICEKEEEYLTILLTSFDLPREQLEEFIEFAQKPDEERVLELMQSMSTKEIKYNFFIDAMMISSIDGHFDENEKAVIEQYYEMFKISKREQEDLEYIFNLFYTQDGNGLFRYFTRVNYIKKERFDYLLDYYGIDFAYELIEDEKKTLEIEFFKPTFPHHFMKLVGADEIAVRPISNAQFSIYLNYALLHNEIEIDGNGKIVDPKDKTPLFDPVNSDIVYDTKRFSPKPQCWDKKITGVTVTAAQRFISWLSKVYNKKYTLPVFWGNDNRNDGDGSFNVDSFSVKPVGEIYYFLYKKNFHFVPSQLNTGFHLNNNDLHPLFSSKEISFRIMKLLP